MGPPRVRSRAGIDRHWLRCTALLRSNWHLPRGEGGGAAREGCALLQGLLRCGRCGRIMQIGYSGLRGHVPRYLCGRARTLDATGQNC
jgi:hypothetical protein